MLRFCRMLADPRYDRETKNRNVAVARLRFVALRSFPCYDQVTLGRNVGAFHVHPSL
jgi:hypothetical protein